MIRTHPRVLRRVLAAGCALVALPLGLASGPAAGAASLAAPSGSPDAAGTVWLCQPGAADDPCQYPLTTTALQANGTTAVSNLTDAATPSADCFFVYPTASTEPGLNSDLVIGPEEIGVAIAEAAPFSQVCRVWAPMYRQETEAALIGPGGTINNTKRNQTAENIAYASVLSAWKDYLANDNDGRPVVFIGHSQGAAMLIRLLSRQIDPDPTLRARMLSAIILGGNVQVPKGKNVGGSFQHIPACRAATETGCVIAYSSFDHTPPANSLFGRPGQGVSLQSDQTAKAGMQVVCTNPAALGGGTGTLQDRFPVITKKVLGIRLTTPWVTYPGLYTGQCRSQGGATWLQVRAKAGDPRPTVSDQQGPIWGLHADDVALSVGNLVHDVATEEAAFAH